MARYLATGKKNPKTKWFSGRLVPARAILPPRQVVLRQLNSCAHARILTRLTFFHPDCTVGLGVSPGRARQVIVHLACARGLYRRSGVGIRTVVLTIDPSPCPEGYNRSGFTPPRYSIALIITCRMPGVNKLASPAILSGPDLQPRAIQRCSRRYSPYG